MRPTTASPATPVNRISNEAQVRTGAAQRLHGVAEHGSPSARTRRRTSPSPRCPIVTGSNEQGRPPEVRRQQLEPRRERSSWIEVACTTRPASTRRRISDEVVWLEHDHRRERRSPVSPSPPATSWGRARSPTAPINVYKNGHPARRAPTSNRRSASAGVWTGRIGVRFDGHRHGSTRPTTPASTTSAAATSPVVAMPATPQRVRGRPRQHVRQAVHLRHAAARDPDAFDAAAASAGNDLVVVYPGRRNRRGSTRAAPTTRT